MPFATVPTRKRWAALAALLALLLAGAAALLPGIGDRAQGMRPALTATGETTLFGSGPQWGRLMQARRDWELGLRFTTEEEGRVVALRHFRSGRDQTQHVGSLWGPDGDLLARVDFGAGTGRGWQRAALSEPVRLEPDAEYTVSYTAEEGAWFVVRPQQFADGPVRRGPLTGLTGVWAGGRDLPHLDGPRSNYLVDVGFVPDDEAAPTGATEATTTSEPTTGGPTSGSTAPPTSTPTTAEPTAPTTGPTTAPTTAPTQPATSAPTSPSSPPAPSDFPGPDDTGVPAGTALTPYDGPCTITRTVTLDAVDATSCDAILVRAPDVVITDSLVPHVDITDGGSDSVSISDSTVAAGAWSEGGVWGYNMTITRTEITGGQHSVHCNDNCVVTDSWLHDQYNPASASFHNNAFITNGGTHMVVRGNTLHCTAVLNANDGGCTADVSLFGDFGPVSDVLVEGNYLRANDSSISYCAYGGHEPSKRFPVATGIRYVGNVFERGDNAKCGVYGPVTSFDEDAAGNVWSGNVWSDGGAVPAG